jgi:hypothetical protein
MILTKLSYAAPLLCFFLAACSAGGGSNSTAGNNAGPSPNADASASADSSGSAPAAAPPSGVGCYEVSQCAMSCADTDDACNNACVAKGTDQAKSLVNAMMSCAQAHACTDGTCLSTNCAAAVEACRNDRTPAASPAPSGGAGSVPPELVGTWSVQSGAATIVDTFNADGTYHEVSGLSTGDGCAITTSFDIQGTASFSASSVTFDQVSGSTSTQSCSSSKSTTPITPKSETKSWLLEGGTLYTWTADCQDYKTCAIQFTKSS